MARDADDQQYLDYVADDPEIIATTPLSPQFTPNFEGLDSLGVSQHAISAANRGPEPQSRHPPPYSYPTAISNQRAAGARTFQQAQLQSTTASSSSSLQVSAAGSTAPFPFVPPPRPINTAATPTFQTSGDWQSSGSGSIYSGSASPVIPLHPNPYDFQYGQGATEQSFGDFVTPTNIHNVQPGFDFTYPWAGSGDSNDGGSSVLSSGMGLSSSLPGTMPSGMRPGLSLGASPEDFSEGAEIEERRPSSSKRAKKSPASDRASISSSQGTHANLGPHGTISATQLDSGSGKQKPLSKLRSAARTSKNQVHRPSETMEERKSRNSHNIVEKQYRNRLNARFESLLNALPDTIRGEGGSGEDSEIQNFDIGEKRVSKAEVLDMARRHIQALERDRDALEKERDDLLDDMEQLRGTLTEGHESQLGDQPSEFSTKRKGKGKKPDPGEEEEVEEEE